MADPVLIEPTLTLAGQAAAFNADNTGLELKITHASFGRAHYDPTGDEVALTNPVGSKIPLAGGSRPTPYQLRMTVAWREDVGEVAVGEIGFWSGDTLVFIWSKADGTKASYKTDGVTYVLFNDLTFAQVPAGSINVDVDPNESVALAALAAHEGSDNAHPQYLLRKDAAKDLGALTWCGLADGGANALTLTLAAAESVIPAYAAGQRFQFMAVLANTGPITANIEGLGPIALRKPTNGGVIALEAGDLSPGVIYDLTYNGTYFQVGGGASGSGGSSTVSVSSSYAPDTGVVNAYKAAYLPAVASLIDGVELSFLAKVANTGASTFSPNGVQAKPIVTNRYVALTAAKIAVGSICTVRYIAALDAWVLVSVTGNAVPTTLSGYGITDAYTKAETDALAGSQAKVVGTPSVTGSSSVTAGTVVSLTASATSLLSGGVIASFTWTLPDGTVSTVAAANGSNVKAVTATGSVGTNYAVTVYATDTAGNKSAVATKLIAITNHAAPTAPTTITVAPTVYQNSTGNTLSVSGSAASDGATITYSITQAGGVALTFSKTAGIAANEVVTFNAGAVAADTQVTVTVMAVDSLGAQSPVKTTVVTVAAIPATAGAAFGGGYFSGKIKADDGFTYALIVSPKATGETLVGWAASGGLVAGANSVNNGFNNTAAIYAAGAPGHPAAQFCKDLTIGGYADWYLPSVNELEILYRSLKPGTEENITVFGTNPSSVPPGSVYTAYNPLQTTVAAFKLGGSEALATTPYGGAHWSSTQTGASTANAQRFTDGYQYDTSTDARTGTAYFVRAVRRVRI